MTNDDFNALVEQVQQINDKTNVLSDSVAKLDLKYSKIKYLSKLIDVNISYPAENDVLVYDKTGKWKNAQYDEIGLSDGEGGESNIYVIGIDDSTSPTNENVYSAARTIEDWVSSKNDDYVGGNLTFYNQDEINPHSTKLFVDEITSRQFNQNTLTGSGFIYQIQSDGTSYIEVDELAVRKSALFNQLEIKKIDAVGGSLIVSVASNKITRVEQTNQLYKGEYQNVWRCYYTNEDSMTGDTIMTDFKPGDIARIQSFNITDTGIHENVKNHYYCGEVLGVSNSYIDLSQTNVDSSTNDSPKAGDSLVQFGNFNNTARQNLISISSYDVNAPSITLYQGVNSFDLTNKSIVEMGYDPSDNQYQGFFKVYGRTYIGTKPDSPKESYVKYDPTIDNGDGSYGRVQIKADIIVEGVDGDKTLISGGYISTDIINTNGIVTKSIIAEAIEVDDGQPLKIGDNLTISNDGTLIAANGTFTGVINANSGTIGGFEIRNEINGSFLISEDTSNQLSLRLSGSGLTFKRDTGTSVQISNSSDGVISATTNTTLPAVYITNTSGLTALQVEGNELLRGCQFIQSIMPTISGQISRGKLPVSQVYNLTNTVDSDGGTFYLPTYNQYVQAISNSNHINLISQPIVIPTFVFTDTLTPGNVRLAGGGNKITDYRTQGDQMIPILASNGGVQTLTFDEDSYVFGYVIIYPPSSIVASSGGTYGCFRLVAHQA